MIGGFGLWQQPEPSPPEPLPVVLDVTERVDLGDWVSIRVETSGELHGLQVIQVRGGDGLAGIDAPVDGLFGPIDGEWRFTHKTPGYYVVEAEVVVDGKPHRTRAVTLIGAPIPVPPGPGPIPPVPVAGLKVLILEEVDDRDSIPRELLTAMFDGPSSSWLSKNTTKDADGSVGWRRWDDDYSDTEQAKMADHWEAIYDRAISDSGAAGDKLPWLYMTDGQRVHSKPFPENPAKFLETLNNGLVQ